jgi:hypothetical protein
MHRARCAAVASALLFAACQHQDRGQAPAPDAAAAIDGGLGATDDAGGTADSRAPEAPAASDATDSGADAASETPDPAAVMIDSIDPAEPHVGDKVTVTGRSFGVSNLMFTIRVGETPIYGQNIDLGHSSDTQLVFTMPSLPNLGAQGSMVALTISNGRTSDSRTITVLPAVIRLEGIVGVAWTDASPATLAAGQPAYFGFNIKSELTLNQTTLTLGASITDASFGALPWPVTILDGSHNPIQPPALVLDVNQTAPVVVRVDPPPGSDGTQFLLLLTASPPIAALARSSGLLPFTVGAAPPQPDPSYALVFVEPFPGSGMPSLVNGDTIVAGPSEYLSLAFEVWPAGAGVTLTVAAHFLAGTTGWLENVAPGALQVVAGGGGIFDLYVGPDANPTSGFVQLDATNTATGVVQSRLFAVQPR